MTRVAPRRYFVTCDSASETTEFVVFPGPLGPDTPSRASAGNLSSPRGSRPLSTGRDEVSKPFVLALWAHGKGIERAAPKRAELGLRGNLLTKY